MAKKPESQGKDRDYKVGYGKPPKHTRFGQPGANPGNRKGKRPSVVKELMRLLDGPDKKDSRKTRCQMVAQSLLSLAEGGEKTAVSAIRTILDRVDGPVRQEITGKDGGPIFLSKAFIDVNASLAAVGVLTSSDVELLGEGEE